MLVTTSFGNFHLGFRYLDGITVATVDPLREDGKPERSGRLSGVAYYNPKDLHQGLPKDRSVGEKIAIQRAFSQELFASDEVEEFYRTYQLLSKVRR